MRNTWPKLLKEPYQNKAFFQWVYQSSNDGKLWPVSYLRLTNSSRSILARSFFASFYTSCASQNTSSSDGWNGFWHARDIVERISESRSNNVGRELGEQDVGQIRCASILWVQGRDKSRVSTSFEMSALTFIFAIKHWIDKQTSILHWMHTSHWKYCHFTRRQCLADHPSTILLHHICVGCSFDSDHQIRGTRMKMGSEHSTWTEIEHCQCHASTNCCWKGCCIRIHDWAGSIRVVFLCCFDVSDDFTYRIRVYEPVKSKSQSLSWGRRASRSSWVGAFSRLVSREGLTVLSTAYTFRKRLNDKTMNAMRCIMAFMFEIELCVVYLVDGAVCYTIDGGIFGMWIMILFVVFECKCEEDVWLKLMKW